VVTDEIIGPLVPMFNQRVGSFLAKNALPSQAACLKEFFYELQNNSVRVAGVRVGPLIIFSVCDLIIEIDESRSLVMDVRPGILSTSTI